MVDNFYLIKPLLKFDNEHEFYFLQIIQRKKEVQTHVLGNNNNNRLIKAYYIYSVDQLDKYKHEITTLCNLFNARAGIGLNRRNARDLSLEMLALLATNIKNNHFNQLSKLYNTICGQHHAEKDKTWIIDLDDVSLEQAMEFGSNVSKIEPCKSPIAYIPSKSGYHIITYAFNSKKFSDLFPSIEIHKNNPTNLYIP